MDNNLDVIFEEEIKPQEIEIKKARPEQILNPSFLFQLDGDSFSVDCFIPEHTRPDLAALFLYKLNKGELASIVMKALLNYSKKANSERAEQVLSEWATLLSKKKPAVRPLQALKINNV